MNQKYINLTDSTLQIKCNHCGNTINIKKGAECRCKYCGQEVDISKCYNYKVSIQSEGYYVYMLQNGIINKDDDMISEASNNLALLSSDNEIFLHIKKRKALKNIEDKKNLDFIVEYLIIQNEEIAKEEKIKKIKTTAYKDEYLKRLDDANEDENIYNNLKDIKVVDLNTHEKKEKYSLSLVFLLLFAFSFLFILITSKFIIKEEILLSSLILLSIIPSILLSIYLLSVIKIKNIFIKVLIFLASLAISFIIISLIYNMIYAKGRINERMDAYFNHLKTCISDVISAINSAYTESEE